MQIIGLCRFSYPAIGGFQVGHETIEERMDYLWAHDRIEERFRLLETMALPCLRAQTDEDFDLLILIGDQFPKQHRDRLREAAKDARPLTKKHKTVGLDWNQGYIAEVGAKGISATQIYRAFYVSALGMHIQGDCAMTIHNFMHERIPQFMPCVTYSDHDMFVRTHNGYNDSRQKKVKDWPGEPLPPKQERLFRNRFAVDVDHVKQVFSAP